MLSVARSATCHSGRLADSRPTRSPWPTPSVVRPAAASSTSAAVVPPTQRRPAIRRVMAKRRPLGLRLDTPTESADDGLVRADRGLRRLRHAQGGIRHDAPPFVDPMNSMMNSDAAPGKCRRSPVEPGRAGATDVGGLIPWPRVARYVGLSDRSLQRRLSTIGCSDARAHANTVSARARPSRAGSGKVRTAAAAARPESKAPSNLGPANRSPANTTWRSSSTQHASGQGSTGPANRHFLTCASMTVAPPIQGRAAFEQQLSKPILPIVPVFEAPGLGRVEGDSGDGADALALIVGDEAERARAGIGVELHAARLGHRAGAIEDGEQPDGAVVARAGPTPRGS